MGYELELDAALFITKQAGELTLRYFDQETPTDEKEDMSPVTIADRESEELICRLLAERFPGDGILGEEGASLPSTTGRRWIIDPIDGTRDFVRRTQFWSVQIALEVDRRVVLGVIHFPCLRETCHAVDGQGCYWDGRLTRASRIGRIDKAILTISGFQDVWVSWPPEAVRYLTEKCWTVRGYSGCYDVTMIARGKADIWLSGNGMPWDYAPAAVIARECGARFITRDGDDRIDVMHCMICAPALEPELRRILSIP
ncbi:MAG: inositol monophosphatase [Acidobacteria bacterium]|nr:inositol monophosphatase [Acidobacteriota bacterium]